MARISVLCFMAAALLAILSQIDAHAQTSPTGPTREERMKKQEGKMVYPFLKVGHLSGVIPVEDISVKPDPSKEVKLIFDFSQATSKGNQVTRINEGLEEVVRTLNLHMAAGVKKEKLKAAIVFHAGSVVTVLNDDYYRQQFQTTNPNLPLLQQLSAAGVELIICGQSLALREFSHSLLIPQIKIALSAKTTLTSYAGKGFFQFDISGE